MRAWLTGVNPVTEPTLSEDGVLTFQNAAVNAGVASPMASYLLALVANGQRDGRGDRVQGGAGGAILCRLGVRDQAPETVLSGARFVQVSIETRHADFPKWKDPVTLTFRRDGRAWQHVGLDRAGLGTPVPGGGGRR